MGIYSFFLLSENEIYQPTMFTGIYTQQHFDIVRKVTLLLYVYY